VRAGFLICRQLPSLYVLTELFLSTYLCSLHISLPISA
jgi:hypothetical protein